MANNLRIGFTVVELLIVIAVIGILAGLGVVGYRGVQTRAHDATLATDASNVSDQIELAFLDSKAYPASLSALGAIKKDSTTTLSYQTDATRRVYCLTATSSRPGLSTYSIASEGKLTKGDCAAAGYVGPPSQPSATVASVTTSSFVVNWTAASGATSYTVRYGTSSPSTVATSCGSLTCTVSGLASNTLYYVTVSANNASGSTVSAQRTARTGSPPLAGPTQIRGGCPDGYFGWAWNSPGNSVVEQFLIDDGYGEIAVDNDLTSTGTFYYPAGQGAQGTGSLTVRFLGVNGDVSSSATGTATFYGDCYD